VRNSVISLMTGPCRQPDRAEPCPLKRFFETGGKGCSRPCPLAQDMAQWGQCRKVNMNAFEVGRLPLQGSVVRNGMLNLIQVKGR